ncbi:MAG: DNA polymerase III subunit gamma/tau [bacterium]
MNSFYRTYRSSCFDELLGQDHVVQTLKHAVLGDRLSHAYIFSGPRGTGKTSTARLLAMALNSSQGAKVFFESGEYCDICQQIALGQSLDVIEIDAASHTGVDHIRQLTEQVQFLPVTCPYKFYIIDEAHMLSTAAFNALLKTIEEPPANVIFILATTEPFKIPATIHSRCQHMQFRPIALQVVAERLRYIADKEKISIDDACLMYLARQSGGCMRDAISLLEQVYSFKGDTIVLADIFFVLGSISHEKLGEFLTLLRSGDRTKIVSLLNMFFESGVSPYQLVEDFAGLLQQFLFFSLDIKKELAVDEAVLALFNEMFSTFSVQKLQAALKIVSEIESELKWFTKPELLVQLRFLELVDLFVSAQESNVGQLVQKVAVVEKTDNTVGVRSPILEKGGVSAAVKQQVPVRQGLSSSDGYQNSYETSIPSVSVDVKEASLAEKIVPSKIDEDKGGGAGVMNVESAQALWGQLIETFKRKHTALYAVLRETKVQQVSGDTLIVVLLQAYDFFVQKLRSSDLRSLIETELKRLSNKTLTYQLKDVCTDIESDKTGASAHVSTVSLNDVVEMFEVSLPS